VQPAFLGALRHCILSRRRRTAATIRSAIRSPTITPSLIRTPRKLPRRFLQCSAANCNLAAGDTVEREIGIRPRTTASATPPPTPSRRAEAPHRNHRGDFLGALRPVRSSGRQVCKPKSAHQPEITAEISSVLSPRVRPALRPRKPASPPRVRCPNPVPARSDLSRSGRL
jgi:hypothetical protein